MTQLNWERVEEDGAHHRLCDDTSQLEDDIELCEPLSAVDRGGTCDDAVPSTSRAGMEAAAAAGNNERNATGSTQKGKRKDVSGANGDVNRGKKS
ncbi:hypothetical protein HPB52_002666 [Rhipicephalus sanguineus]|uniref:Uncharacterized protein n=1 Tax=Rhipicephalus sanguineus TaxID=34632 RepID=A0A9D4PBI4_RHISA|nr:hypothetical protein HPB52_002666 [Rhipicephalus sanguineus]